MSLDLGRLRFVRRVNGKMVAQCPACAEAGHDRHGKNHLVVWSSGQFACVSNPGDKGHRKRIWELAGDRRAKAPLPSMAVARRGWRRQEVGS